MIHQTHLLLFGTAIMHIVITCLSFYASLARVSWREKGWRRGFVWEGRRGHADRGYLPQLLCFIDKGESEDGRKER